MGFFDRYPYTNWHNVNLDWVLERVKEWGELVVTNDQAFKDLEEANESFKEYVTNYLQDLDVQEQIDDKLDRMFESGELAGFLQPYVSSTVTVWLEDNITEPVGVVIDSSLTVAGAAADAKAAGDRISEAEYKADRAFILSTQLEAVNHELMDNSITETYNLIDGYSSLNTNTAAIAIAPYIFPNYNINGKIIIDRITLKALTVGTLTIGKYPKEYYNLGFEGDKTKFIPLATLEVTGLNEQTININPAIEIDYNYYIAVGISNDAVTFTYGPNGTDKGFAFISPSTMRWAYSTNSLGITIHGTTEETNYRSVIKSVLRGKRISFYGDSITTYANYIPSGMVTYYPYGDVTNVNDTYWMKVIKALDLKLDTNNSWSGCRVTTTYSEESAGCMERTAGLGNPDIIIIYMGINDFNADIPLGSYNGRTAIPTNTELFETAYAIMLNKILTNYPQAKVYTCTLLAEERNLSEGFPEVNENGDSLTDYNNSIKKISNIFSVEVIDIDKCGITYQNMSVYNPNKLHPNKAGHSLLANYIIECLDEAVPTRY